MCFQLPRRYRFGGCAPEEILNMSRPVAADTNFEGMGFQKRCDGFRENRAIGGNRKADPLRIVRRMALNQVGDILDQREFQKRLSAEESDFDFAVGGRMMKDEIERPLGRRQRHGRGVLPDVAIGAGKITSKCNTKGVPARSTTQIIARIPIHSFVLRSTWPGRIFRHARATIRVGPTRILNISGAKM